MASSEMTDMGEGDGLFHTTRWTEIHGIRSDDEQQRRACLEMIAKRYWRPVYVFLRRKGLSNDAAKEATQGFFTKVILGRRLLERADPKIGKFRSYLRHALNNYRIDELRAARARTPAGGLVNIDAVPDVPADQTQGEVSPELAFDHAWASALVGKVLAQVQADCHRRDQLQHWQVFEARVLQPIMEGADTPGLDELAQRLGIGSAKQASDMIITVKRKFRSALRKEISGTVETQDQIEEELANLKEILSAGGSEWG